MSYEAEIFTIGHSTHSYEQFRALLRKWEISAVADVRSLPYSRRISHFDRNEIYRKLKSDNISYVYLGEELGGRPQGDRFFCNGVADYEAMARSTKFAEGISRILKGKTDYRIALMCSERSPFDCHRCLLVGRALQALKIPIGNILGNGELKMQTEIERDLLKMAGLGTKDIFKPDFELIDRAYRERAQKVAYSLANQNQSLIIE